MQLNFVAEKLPQSFPTIAEVAFLKASLLDGDEAIESWREWDKLVGLDNIDSATYRLAPILYKNLKRIGFDDPIITKLKGTYKHNWVKNQRLMHIVTPLIRSLSDRGIPTLLLKGLPLNILAYEDIGGRQMGDVDLAVPREFAIDAIEILVNEGWNPVNKRLLGSRKRVEGQLSIFSGYEFRTKQKLPVDLHWHIIHENYNRELDEDFWRYSSPLEFNGVESKSLSREDMLVNVALHGVRFNHYPQFRWVADLFTIINRWPDLKWDRVVKRSKQLNGVPAMESCLKYLKREFYSPVPSDVIKELSEINVSFREQRRYNYISSPKFDDKKTSVFGKLRYHWYRFRQISKSNRGIFKPYGFAKYLQHALGAESVGELPSAGVKAFRFHLRRAKRRRLRNKTQPSPS